MSSRFGIVWFVIALILSLPQLLFAASGDLDTSFGTGGVVRFGFGFGGDYPKAMALQGDGKIIAVGQTTDGSKSDFFVIRLNLDGSLDSSFGAAGKVLMPFGSGGMVATAVAVDANGKIVVGGYVQIPNGQAPDLVDFAVARLNPDGSPDTTFNGTGMAVIAVTTGTDQALAMALDALGRIVLAGRSGYYDNNGFLINSLTVVRLMSNGTMDTTFGSGGTVMIRDGGIASALALDSAGKIVVAGTVTNPDTFQDFVVWRFNSDGTLDPGFAGQGAIAIAVGPVADQATAMTIDANGRIIVAGTIDSALDSQGRPITGADFSVVRLNANGTLDTSFGTGGGALIPVGAGPSNDFAYALRIDSAGRIVVAGASNNFITFNHDFAFVRLNDNGTLDSSFGSGGKLVLPVGSGDDVAQALAIDSSGRMIAAGWSAGGSPPSVDTAVVRLGENGVLDGSLGTGGKFVLDVGDAPSETRALAVQADGKVLLAGRCACGPTSAMTVARINNDGSPDAGFGVGGRQIISFGPNAGIANAVARTADGKIVVAGSYNNSQTFNDFAVTRLNADGSLDTTFGSGGKALIQVGDNDDFAYAVAVDANDRIIVAGSSLVRLASGASSDEFAVVRLNPDGTLDTSFGTGGKVIFSPAHFGNLQQVNTIALDAGGKIILAGANGDFTIVRLNSDGLLDSGFGSGGTAAVAGGQATSVAIDPGGRIVVGGISFVDPTRAMIIRFNANGTLDTSFGAGGKALLSFGSNAGVDAVNGVTLLPDGKIVVSGKTFNNPGTTMAVARLNPDGSPDAGFGAAGIRIVSLGSSDAVAYAVAATADGRLLVAGVSNGATTIVRLLNGSAVTSTSSSGGTAASADVVTGWNLLGNSSSAALDVAAIFGDASKVTTVWKWIAAKAGWAFYAPGLSDGGAAYARSKGYDFLTSINGGEGFWVNAKGVFKAQLPSGTAITSASFQSMASGWSLNAVGDNPTPSAFNKAISMTPPSPGDIPLNLTTLWTWDAALSNWYFYAPSLENSGGLLNYIQSKNYLDFGAKTLMPTTGFWVNQGL